MSVLHRTKATTPSSLDYAPSADGTAIAPVNGRIPSRIGSVLHWLVVAFLLFDCVTKILRMPQSVQGTLALGFQSHHVQVIGTLLAAGLALYLVPRTRVLGALWIIAYLGGAVCANLRVDAPLWTFVLSPVYIGILLGLSVYLRNPRVRSLIHDSRPTR
jgi:hypothetical protein